MVDSNSLESDMSRDGEIQAVHNAATPAREAAIAARAAAAKAREAAEEVRKGTTAADYTAIAEAAEKAAEEADEAKKAARIATVDLMPLFDLSVTDEEDAAYNIGREVFAAAREARDEARSARAAAIELREAIRRGATVIPADPSPLNAVEPLESQPAGDVLASQSDDALESQPADDALESQPAGDALESQPAEGALEPQPAGDVLASQSDATLESQPAGDVLASQSDDALESQPAGDVLASQSDATLESQPGEGALEPQPAEGALEPQPAGDVLASEPEAVLESQPDVALESQPEAALEPQPAGDVLASQPGNALESQPAGDALESQPSDALESQPADAIPPQNPAVTPTLSATVSLMGASHNNRSRQLPQITANTANSQLVAENITFEKFLSHQYCHMAVNQGVLNEEQQTALNKIMQDLGDKKTPDNNDIAKIKNFTKNGEVYNEHYKITDISENSFEITKNSTSTESHNNITLRFSRKSDNSVKCVISAPRGNKEEMMEATVQAAQMLTASGASLITLKKLPNDSEKATYIEAMLKEDIIAVEGDCEGAEASQSIDKTYKMLKESNAELAQQYKEKCEAKGGIYKAAFDETQEQAADERTSLSCTA